MREDDVGCCFIISVVVYISLTIVVTNILMEFSIGKNELLLLLQNMISHVYYYTQPRLN